MDVRLLEIPGLAAQDQGACKIRVLAVNGTSLALEGLAAWEDREPADFKKIMKVMRMLGNHGRHLRDEDKVKKCANTAYGDVYEMRADKGKARLMFFYDDENEVLVICTNYFWKGSGSQDTAFKHCAELKKVYFKFKYEKHD
jgi:hypothetical protein